MYLTQLPIKAGDDYQQHQAIRNIFPGDQKILFQSHDAGVLVLSDKKPEAIDVSVMDVNVSSYENGGKYAFTIRLNPVKRDINTKKRVAIEADMVKAWIRKQLSSAGVDVIFQYVREGTRRSFRQGKKVSLVSVLCFGVLTIKDADTFQKALVSGIGHGKGFGFGMLNVFSS
jgi:CRISPR-associated protein Cas6/Cse3/CasE subtype I-E